MVTCMDLLYWAGVSLAAHSGRKEIRHGRTENKAGNREGNYPGYCPQKAGDLGCYFDRESEGGEVSTQEYQLAYTTPPIEKVSTNFVLPPMNIDNYWMALHGGDKYGIYFVQSAEGYIKIGKSNDMFRRLSNYRTHHPMMRLVGVITPAPDYIDYNENLLHRLWEPFIVSLEWFAPVRPLIEYIRSFDETGDGHPLELLNTEPATWKELLTIQKQFKAMEIKRGSRR